MRSHNLRLQLRLERDDAIPAFGAFLACEPPCDDNHVILLNVEALLSPTLVDEDGSPVDMSREERKRGVIASMTGAAVHRAYEHGRARLGAAALWHHHRVETQLQTMEDGEWRDPAERVLPGLLSTGSEVLLERTLKR